jgi:hypothetical protein
MVFNQNKEIYMTLPDFRKELEELINLYLEKGDSAEFKAKLERLALALGIL